MVVVIQKAKSGDVAATTAKLDELIRAVDNARGHFIDVEHLTDRPIEDTRTAPEKDCSYMPDRYEEKGGHDTKPP